MNSFQTITLGIFGFFIIVGLLVVATVKSNGRDSKVPIAVWGSRPRAEMSVLINRFFENNKTISVSYREVREENLDQILLEALAIGKGPDLVILPLELLLRNRDKISPIPYTNYSKRTFLDTFVQEGDLFLQENGIAALPFTLDPLVMYWNRDFLDEAGLTTPPKYWDEFLELANNITERDEEDNISRGAIALGEYENVNSAKEILSALFLQSGSQIFGYDTKGVLRGDLRGKNAGPVLDFFTEFANPLKPVYSWNRSLPESKEQFLASRLAVYLGFGSEYTELQKGNPNLNFDVALLPRPRNASVGITYGKMTGVALLRSSRKTSVALQVALILGSPEASGLLHGKNGLPPVHRNLLASKPDDAFGAVMYDSASRARGFLDPNPALSKKIFKNMVESVTSGREHSTGALLEANQALENAIR